MKVIIILLGCWSLLMIYGHFDQKRKAQLKLKAIKEEVPILIKRLEALSEYIHPSNEFKIAMQEINYIQSMKLDDVKNGAYRYSNLKEKIQEREFLKSFVIDVDKHHCDFLANREKYDDEFVRKIDDYFEQVKALKLSGTKFSAEKLFKLKARIKVQVNTYHDRKFMYEVNYISKIADAENSLTRGRMWS